jgi:hypothetical protein
MGGEALQAYFSGIAWRLERRVNESGRLWHLAPLRASFSWRFSSLSEVKRSWRKQLRQVVAVDGALSFAMVLYERHATYRAELEAWVELGDTALTEEWDVVSIDLFEEMTLPLVLAHRGRAKWSAGKDVLQFNQFGCPIAWLHSRLAIEVAARQRQILDASTSRLKVANQGIVRL